MSTLKTGLKICTAAGELRFGALLEDHVIPAQYQLQLDGIFNSLSGLSAEYPAYVYSTVEGGHLITLVVPRDGGSMNYATVYVPCNLAIRGQELEDMLRICQEELLAPQPDSSRLSSLFNAEFPVGGVEMPVYLTEGQLLAIRYFGGENRYDLADFLGTGMSQPEYSRFKAVIFAHAKSGIVSEGAADLSASPLKEYVVVFPPEESMGYQAFYANAPFTAPHAFAAGDKVRFYWKRHGYKNIEKNMQVSPEASFVPPVIPEEIYKYITYDSITVRDDKSCIIENYTLRVNGKILEKGMMLAVKELNIKEIPVTISSEGFNTVDTVMDLSEPVSVTLEKRTYDYSFVLPLGKYGEFKIPLTTDAPLEHSPLRGYQTEGAPVPNVRNYLKYNPKDKYRLLRSILFAVAGVLVGVLIGWMIFSSSGSADMDRLRFENSALRSRLSFYENVDIPEDELIAEKEAELKAEQEAQAKLEAEQQAAKAAAEKEAAEKAAAEKAAAEKAAAEKADAEKAAAEKAAEEKQAEEKAAEEKAAEEQAVARRNAKIAFVKAFRERKADIAKAEQEKAAREKAEQEIKQEAKSLNTPKASAQGIKYLDSNAKWSRAEMEAYPEFQGLWDAINERDFNKILSYSENLSASVKFTELCNSIRRLKTIPGTHFTQKYCTDPADTEITYMSYLNKIDGKYNDLKGGR